jgi:hypothetical protein
MLHNYADNDILETEQKENQTGDEAIYEIFDGVNFIHIGDC